MRGWIVDVEQPPSDIMHTVETEAARKAQLFQSINVWIDGAPYVSGGVDERGSFILLDVPPGNVTISFAAPGAPNARLELRNVPGNADVFIPALLLTKTGATPTEPTQVQVRLAAKITAPHPTGKTAKVANLDVPVVDVPINTLSDRHDYPDPGGVAAPVATVK